MKLSLPINFVARQSVWALEHQQPLQFLDVPQAQRLNALLRLDYSPRSIERIQQWLDKQRALRVAAGRTVFDAERDHDVLMLLGFYVAEWVARTMGGVPSWSQVGDAFIVNFPEDRKASVGMLSFKGVPLVIAPGVSRHVKLLPHPVWSEAFRSLWLDACEARLGQRHRVEDLQQQARDADRKTAVQLLLAEAAAARPATPAQDARADAPTAARARRVAEPPQGPGVHAPEEDAYPRGFSWRFVAIGMVVMAVAMLAIMRLSSAG